MTVENCKRLLEHYKASIDDTSLSKQARLNAKVAFENMKKNLEARGEKSSRVSKPASTVDKPE